MPKHLPFALLLLSTPAFAANAPYLFTPIADTTGPFSVFNYSAINNNGQIAFKAGLDAGGQGIYVASPSSAPAPIAFSGATLPGNGAISSLNNELDINDAGIVVFGAPTSTSGSSSVIALGSVSSPLQPLSNTGSAIAGLAISNSGFASFVGGASTTSVTLSNGTFSSNIASSSATLTVLNGLGATSVNSNNIVAFLGANSTGAVIYSNVSGAVAPLLDASGPFKTFSSVAENNAGTVAFQGNMDDNSKGIFTVSATGALTTIVPTNSSYFKIYVGMPSINNAGKVLFLGGDTSAHLGIYTGPDPAADKVLVDGDALLGSTVTSLASLSQNLNDAGQIALRATLANGISYLLLASPASPGDANADGNVDLSDLSIILNNFGQTTSAWSNGNFDNAPTIDLTDLSDVLNNFGQLNPGLPTALSPAATSTPEPTTFSLTLAATTLLITRRRNFGNSRTP